MKKFSRVVVVAPTRSTCLNISMVLANGTIPKTLLMQEREKEIFEAVDCLDLGGFGVVAGTGTGKTVAIRDIAGRILGEKLSVDVVTREHEATERTWQCNTLVVTPGVALNWFKSNVLSLDDLLVFDEIHQTSEHLELTLALAKRAGCTFIWMSATIDPTLYSEYLNAATVIECSAFDPSKQAEVECKYQDPKEFFSDEQIDEFIAEERAVAVFVPTRAMAENLSREYGQKDGLYCDFYHGGEKAEKLRQFLKGDVPKPFMVFMTIAGASSLNILGLDTVVIVDEMFKEVVHSGVPVLQKVRLGNNELLQMGGRVNGRMENSRIYILTPRNIEFHSLQPAVPEFVLGGDLQRVALTCAKLGVNASELDLISPIDSDVYGAEVQRFRDRGIIEANSENLTPYGRKVERLPVEPSWAELVVNAEKMSSDLCNIVIISSCIESLYSLLRKNYDLRGVGVSGSDHLTAYNIVVTALRSFGYIQKSRNGGGTEYGFRGDWVKKRFNKQTGQTEKSMGEFAQWCDHMNFNAKSIKEATLAMKSMYRQLGINLPEPMKLQLVSNNDYLHLSFVELLAKVQSLDFVHSEKNSKAQSAYGTVWAAQCSMAGAQRTLGKIRHWTDRRGTQRATVEGTDISQDLIVNYATKMPERVTKVTDEGVEIEFRAVFAGERLDIICQVVADNEIPVELISEAEQKFIDAFASKYLIGAEVVVDKNAKIRVESERLWIRSGGEFQRITQQDERELYERELLGKGIVSIQSFERELHAGRVNVQALFLAPISNSERKRIEQENPETVEVDNQILSVLYSKDSWSDTFYAKVKVDSKLTYATKTESVVLPSGRQATLVCDGHSANTFPELVEKLEKARIKQCWAEARSQHQTGWTTDVEKVVGWLDKVGSQVEVTRANNGSGEPVCGHVGLKRYSGYSEWQLFLADTKEQAEEETRKSLEVLLKTAVKEYLAIPKEEPWQKSGYWNWELTDLGCVLQSRFEALVREYAEGLTPSNIKEKIEALKTACEQAKLEVGEEYESTKKIIEDTKSSLEEKISSLDNQDFVSSEIEEVHKLVGEAEEALASGSYADAKEKSKEVNEILKKIDDRIAQLQVKIDNGEILVGFEAWHRRGGMSRNGDGWVIRPDGSLRERDSDDVRRYKSDGTYRWNYVNEDELALKWSCGTMRDIAGSSEFIVAKMPVGELTDAQRETVRRIELEDIGTTENSFGLDPEATERQAKLVAEVAEAFPVCPVCKKPLTFDQGSYQGLTGEFGIHICQDDRRISRLVNWNKPFDQETESREAQVVVSKKVSDGVVEALAYEKWGGWNVNLRWREMTEEELAEEKDEKTEILDFSPPSADSLAALTAKFSKK